MQFFDDYEEGVTQEQTGVKSTSLFLSALGEPQQTYNKEELYPTVFLKAACLVRSIIKNHPFHNGNKRTAVLAMIVFLEMNSYVVVAQNNQLKHFARGIAMSKQSVERISRTIKKWCRYTPPTKDPHWKRMFKWIRGEISKV